LGMLGHGGVGWVWGGVRRGVGMGRDRRIRKWERMKRTVIKQIRHPDRDAQADDSEEDNGGFEHGEG
jgi:hypothetical protein